MQVTSVGERPYVRAQDAEHEVEGASDTGQLPLTLLSGIFTGHCACTGGGAKERANNTNRTSATIEAKGDDIRRLEDWSELIFAAAAAAVTAIATQAASERRRLLRAADSHNRARSFLFFSAHSGDQTNEWFEARMEEKRGKRRL